MLLHEEVSDDICYKKGNPEVYYTSELGTVQFQLLALDLPVTSANKTN